MTPYTIRGELQGFEKYWFKTKLFSKLEFKKIFKKIFKYSIEKTMHRKYEEIKEIRDKR